MDTGSVDGIICYSTDPWGDMKRPGQLMRRLSERVPVLYVEPHLSLTSVIKNWRTALGPASRERLYRGLSGRTGEVSPGIHVLSSLVTVPPQRLSFLSASCLGRITERQQRRTADRAHRAAMRLGMSSAIIWISYPTPLIGSLDVERAGVVYDCMDRWTDFPDAISDAGWRGLVAEYERQLLATADVVFCSAAGLFESKRRTATGRVLLLRNGADVEHFSSRARRVPDDIAHLPHPIIGYVGAIAEWVDFELLRSVALLRPDWSLVLIGPVFRGKTSGDPRALKLISNLPNVHLLGPRPYPVVPAYLEAFDVATIPFRLNGLTEDTNPIKVYEYLAAGLPVVSTPLPELQTLPEVRLAMTATEFIEQAEAARLERLDIDRLSHRVEVAERNSWEARAEVAWEAISELPGGRSSATTPR